MDVYFYHLAQLPQPDNITFVARPLQNGTYLIGSPSLIEGATPLTQDELIYVCHGERFDYGTIMSWFV